MSLRAYLCGEETQPAQASFRHLSLDNATMPSWRFSMLQSRYWRFKFRICSRSAPVCPSLHSFIASEMYHQTNNHKYASFPVNRISKLHDRPSNILDHSTILEPQFSPKSPSKKHLASLCLAHPPETEPVPPSEEACPTPF